jgi:hypothetical protein
MAIGSKTNITQLTATVKGAAPTVRNVGWGRK